MNPDITIRPALAEDAATVLRITDRSVRGLSKDAYSPQQIDDWIKDREPSHYLPHIEAGQIYIAEENGSPVAFVDAGKGEIFRLFVVPEAAGKGVGRTLLEFALPLARKGHDGPVIVEATLNAESFYAQYGFVTVGYDYFSHGVGETQKISIIKMELR